MPPKQFQNKRQKRLSDTSIEEQVTKTDHSQDQSKEEKKDSKAVSKTKGNLTPKKEVLPEVPVITSTTETSKDTVE